MSAGTPARASKKTLCATEPNAKVTTSPAFTVRVAGVNARPGVAATVRPSPGAVGPPFDPYPPLQAASVTATSVRTGFLMCLMQPLPIICLCLGDGTADDVDWCRM